MSDALARPRADGRAAVLCAAVLLLWSLVCADARAHQAIMSVYVVGDTVEGEVGFSTGVMAAERTVQITDGSGAVLGSAQTDGEGMFRYVPTVATHHHFRADLGSGHIAEARLEVSELPAKLAAPSVQPPADNRSVQTETNAVPAGNAGATPALDEAAVAAIVARELQPLRRQITEYQRQQNLQSVLGGIGYIVGLFGLAFYFVARSKLRAAADAGAAGPGETGPLETGPREARSGDERNNTVGA